MQSLRPLIRSLIISLCFVLGFWHFAPAGSAASAGLRGIGLVPLALCPLLSGGIALHEYLEERRPGLARLIRHSGVALFLLLALLLLWL